MSYEHVSIFLVPGIENAYFLHSSKKNENGVHSSISLIYKVSESVAVEWIPDGGPITTLRKCNKDADGATPCPFFGFIQGRGEWNQLLVDELNLVDLFVKNDLESVFSILDGLAN
jgi:hypothetical protein